jgi:hypothetical protein
MMNCKNLSDLDNLKFAYGVLDIRGTAIKTLQKNFGNLFHRVITDLGDFEHTTFGAAMPKARRAFRKAYGKTPALPAREEMKSLPPPKP